MTDSIIVAALDSPEAAPLVAALGGEYATRYADYDGFPKQEGEPEEIDLFPPLVFEAPTGTLLLVRRDGETIAGGGFMYLDDETAEIKRVWTSPDHRRQGLSRTVMTALEDAAAARGYRRIYLSTGPRQPEAVGLYLSLGYTALFDLDADPEAIAHLAFEKELGEAGGRAAAKAAAQRAAVAEAHRWHQPPPVRLADLTGR
ncbi:GNAT family N-acetyltransferase [Corynebacterium nuruki]|jgi:GNAT superfamily N-acetyltransferase